MPSATSIINQINSALNQVGPPARLARLRNVVRTGGDPLIGKKATITFTDFAISPQPVYNRIGREHVPGGHADAYDYIDGVGKQRLADDYSFVFSPNAISRDQLENPDNLITLTDSDGTIELLSMHDIEPASIYGTEVLFTVYMRSEGETNGKYSLSFSNSTSVRVDYNMATDNVVPFVTDSSGNPLPYSTFTVGNSNSATLTFSVPTSGTIVVKSVTLLNGFAMNYTTGASNGSGGYDIVIPHRLGTTSLGVCVYNSVSDQITQPVRFITSGPNSATVTLSAPESGTIIVYPQ